MEIKMDEQLLQAAMSKALTESISDDVRRQVFSNAVFDYLFKNDRHGDNRLSDNIRRAIDNVASELIREHLKSPGMKEALLNEISNVFDSVLKDEKVSERLAEKISRAIY